MRRLSLLIALVFGVGLAPTPVAAVSVTPEDLDGILAAAKGTGIASMATMFQSSPSSGSVNIAELTVTVSQTGAGTQFWEFEVNPLGANIEEINTGFALENLVRAGYSFTEAAAAGGGQPIPNHPLTGTPWDAEQLFFLNHESDGTFDVNANPFLAGWWAPDTAVTFFFEIQATAPPHNGGTWNISSGSFGQTTNLAPAAVPEPSTVLLLASGLVGLGAWGRRMYKASNWRAHDRLDARLVAPLAR